MKIEVLRDTLLHEQKGLAEEITHIMLPFYQDPTAVIDRELKHCNSIYMARDNAGLAAFAMFAWEKLFVEGEGTVPSLYAGLCGSRNDLQRRGLVFKLWFHACREAVQLEKETGARWLAWATTATPITYFGGSIFHDLEPRLDGTFQDSYLKYVEALRVKLGVNSSPSEHPYILRGVAQNTRYSNLENNAIAEFSRKNAFTLLQDLGIRESNGDRLLMIGRFKSEFNRNVRQLRPCNKKRKDWENNRPLPTP